MAPTAATHLERVLWRVGIEHVAGVDEVGMGPLAGPVVAAAVVFPAGTAVEGLADSKTLSALQRERLAAVIRARAAAIGVGLTEPDELDRINVYQAGLTAMRRALAALAPLVPGFVLVDGREIPGIDVPQCAYVKGDSFIASVAAASIIAKVHRDALMCALDARFPQYGFARHMGYGTPVHLEALRVHGPCPVHRRSFAPVAAAAGIGVSAELFSPSGT
jgi:ribonuclease HII